jgi:hypothetical protein
MEDTMTQARIPNNLSLVAPADVLPLYEHDCDHCWFLGRYMAAEGEMDLYVHPERHPTVIARFSSDGPDYSSGTCFAYGMREALTEARRRAQVLGLAEYDVYDALESGCTGSSLQELREALPFTPEYQAVLAYERGDTLRFRGLAVGLVASDWLRQGQRKGHSVYTHIAYVEHRIAKILGVLRESSHRQTVMLTTAMFEFLWHCPAESITPACAAAVAA